MDVAVENEVEDEDEREREEEKEREREASLHQAVIQRQSRHNSLVTLGSLFKLLDIERAVLVLVHHAEDFAHALFGRVLVFG